MSIFPAKYTLAVWEGSTFRKTMTVLSGAAGSNPLDLTGYTAVLDIRTAPDTTPVYTLSTANGQITLGGITGTIALWIPAADTLTFDTWGAGVYELNITDVGNSGDVTTLMWGPFRTLGFA